MAFQASLPLVVIGGAVMGLTLVSNSNLKRTVLEHSIVFDEYCFKHGVLPPRTKYDPYVSKKNASRFEEQCKKEGTPLTMHPGQLSWVTAGGASDPYRGRTDGVILLHKLIRNRTLREEREEQEKSEARRQSEVDYFFELARLNSSLLKQVPELTKGMPKQPLNFQPKQSKYRNDGDDE